MICAKLGVSLLVARVANLQTSLVISVVFINSTKGLQLTLKLLVWFCFVFFIPCCTKNGKRSEGMSGPHGWSTAVPSVATRKREMTAMRNGLRSWVGAVLGMKVLLLGSDSVPRQKSEEQDKKAALLGVSWQ